MTMPPTRSRQKTLAPHAVSTPDAQALATGDVSNSFGPGRWLPTRLRARTRKRWLARPVSIRTFRNAGAGIEHEYQTKIQPRSSLFKNRNALMQILGSVNLFQKECFALFAIQTAYLTVLPFSSRSVAKRNEGLSAMAG